MAEDLLEKTGYIQREILLWLNKNWENKNSLVDMLREKGLVTERIVQKGAKTDPKAPLIRADTKRLDYYKAMRRMKERGLVKSTKEGRKAVVKLTPKGHAAAIALLEEMGQQSLFNKAAS